MKKIFSLLIALVLVLSFSVVAVPAGVVEGSTSTIDVTQPVQVTSNSYYERGQSIVYDGSNYWLFYGRSDSVTATYGTGNPDTHDYKIYYKTAPTVAGLATASATLLSDGNNADIYLGETDAAYYNGSVRVYAAVDVGSTCDLYQFYYDGSNWGSNVMVSGMPDGAAHFAVTTCDGKLWFAYQEGNDWNSKYYESGVGWSSVYDITNNYGTAKFYVEGTNLYFVRADSGDQDIFEWNSGTSSWSLVDSDTESGPWDPAIYKVGSNYVCAYAPWASKQWIKAKVNTDLNHLLDLTGGAEVAITFGGYSTTNTWTDMWPTGFTDNSGDTYLFYTSERNPSDPSTEIAGNIWYLKVDWPVTNDHYTYIQNAVDAASSTTINVAAGTYAGATVNKDVTIQAKPGDTVIINDGPNTHATLRAAFYFAGDYSGNGATIRGFRFQGFNQGDISADDGKLDFGVFSRGANGVTVENNIITDMLQAITNWHGSNWHIDNNQINNLWTSNGGGIGIIVGAYNGATVNGNIISDNKVSGTLSVWASDGGGYDGTGIVLYADFRWGSPGGVVTENSVIGNEISMVSDTPGTVNFNGIELTDTRDDANTLTAVYANNVSENNVYNNSGDGIAVSAGAANNDVNFNNIVDNGEYGLSYSGTAVLDATHNWWGSSSGPYHATLNPSGMGNKVSDNVDFDPWVGKTESVPTITDTGTASFTPSAGVIEVTAVATPPNPPVELPHGMFSFNITGLTDGQIVTVTIVLPDPVPRGTKWWKYQGGSWYSLDIGDDDGDNTITITLTDGVFPGDADSITGQITDPGGPGYPLSLVNRGLIISSTEGGRVTKPGEGNYVYRTGTVVKLVATPDDGYRFVGWTGDVDRIADVDAATTTITMTYFSVITANFEAVETPSEETLSGEYTLTISSTAGGSVTSPGEGTSAYEAGTVVNLVAIPDDGYEFVKWGSTVTTIADVNAATTTITMNDDYSITAHFEETTTSSSPEGTEGTEGTGGSSGPLSCFIATAAYGTPTAEQIDVLREFRDVVLLESNAGSQFVALYYQLSPPIADFIAGNGFLRTMVKELLVDPIVWVVEATGDIWRN